MLSRALDSCLPGVTEWRTDPLGEYRWFDVEGGLTKLADAVWIYGGRDKILTSQLLVPHWKTCLAVVRQWDSRSALPCDVHFAILGPVSIPRWNDDAKNIEVVAVRLQPEAVAPVLDLKPGDILDRDIVIKPTNRLDAVRRLAEDGAVAERIAAALIAFLEGVWEDCGKLDHASAAAARLLRRPGDPVRVSEVAGALDISERTLRRRFEQYVGISPKYYARQSRLKHVLLEVDRFPRPNWSALAHDFGYFDQAHMIEDLRSLTGFGPSQLHAMRRAAPVQQI